jgi:hypothetical protein
MMVVVASFYRCDEKGMNEIANRSAVLGVGKAIIGKS